MITFSRLAGGNSLFNFQFRDRTLATINFAFDFEKDFLLLTIPF